MTAVSCPFCDLSLKNEKIYFEDETFLVLQTDDLKGHHERIMIILKQHLHTIPREAYERALDVLTEIGRKIFGYTAKFIIMDTTFATINDHWHLVATDLNPESKDFDQILATRWIQFVDNSTDEVGVVVS